MSKLTTVRRALLAAVAPAVEAAKGKAEVVTGPQKADPRSRTKLGPAVMVIRAYVGDPTDEANQDALDLLLDDEAKGSLIHALFADQKLGDVIELRRVVGSSGWRTWQTASGPVLGAELTVEVQPK